MSVTLFIIAITSLFSLTALYLQPRLLEWGMLRPYRMVRKQLWHEVITSGFLHAGFMHLLVNMFVLFFFGSILEQNITLTQYISLYLSGLIVSSLPSVINHKDNPNFATIGASGGVESVLFGFIVLFPTDSIYFIFLPVPIPAWVFGLLFLAYSVYESKRGRGNINHEAHIAGAVWGIIYMLLFIPNNLDHILTLLGII